MSLSQKIEKSLLEKFNTSIDMNELKRILPTVHLPLYKDTGKKYKYLNIKSNIF